MPLDPKPISSIQMQVSDAHLITEKPSILVCQTKEYKVTLIDIFLDLFKSIADFFADLFASKSQVSDKVQTRLDNRSVTPLSTNPRQTNPKNSKHQESVMKAPGLSKSGVNEVARETTEISKLAAKQKQSNSDPSSSFALKPVEKKKSVRGIDCSKKVKTYAPVGIRNGWANCWVNSMLQMIAKAPSIARKILERENCKEIAFLLREYYDSQISSRPISNIDSQIFRTWFKNFDLVSMNISSHTDLSEALLKLFELIEYNCALYETEYFPERERTEELGDGAIVWLDLSDGIRSFESLFLNFFSSFTQNGSQVKKFENAPEDLIIELKKLPLDEVTEIPIDLTLPSAATNGDKGAIDYEFISCIIHSGDSESGHYITVQREGKNYYLIDDSEVIKISYSKAINLMKYGKFFHYRRTDVTALNPQQFARPIETSWAQWAHLHSPVLSLPNSLYFTALTVASIAVYSLL